MSAPLLPPLFGGTSQSVEIDERGLVNMLLSSRRLLVIVFMLVIFTGAAQPITDRDFWWHLKTGQYIVDTKRIPHTDFFSTLRFGSEWVTHEWLSEVVIYSVFRTLGYSGLIVVSSIVITAAFFIAYERCRKLAGHPYVAGSALLLGAMATMPTWGARPHIFSILFASIFLSFLDDYSYNKNVKSIWWLVPLMILWVNMHAGFALGIGLILLAIMGLLLDRFWLPDYVPGDFPRRVCTLCLLLIICVAVVFLNPSGTRLYSYPFETLSSHAMMQNIQEWSSPDFHNPIFQALALLFLVTFSALALSAKRVRPSELLLLVVTGWATLRSSRNVPFFALVAMPLLAEHSWSWITGQRWGQWLAAPENREAPVKSAPKLALNVLLLGIALTLVVVGVKKAVANQPLREAQDFPAAAVDFIQSSRPPQPIFNEYNWGGYLIWRLYPDYRVYIDGRADVYGDELVQEFVNVREGRTAWRVPLDHHGIRTVLVKSEAPLASLLREDNGWHNVFEDTQAVIFVRK